jgi:hypothetical protein
VGLWSDFVPLYSTFCHFVPHRYPEAGNQGWQALICGFPLSFFESMWKTLPIDSNLKWTLYVVFDSVAPHLAQHQTFLIGEVKAKVVLYPQF